MYTSLSMLLAEELEVAPDHIRLELGDSVVNLSQGKTCLSCHQPAARFHFVCEKGHGCAPIPFIDHQLALNVALEKAIPILVE